MIQHEMSRILYIAYHFPPLGGAGVQRSLKFVKYLPEFGVEPLVLTGTGSDNNNRWTPADESLLDDLDQPGCVNRTPWTLSPARGSFVSNQLAAARELVRRYHFSLIIVSASPFEDLSVAATLASELEIPWIADLRDPWALDEFQVYRSAWHRHRERQRMRVALRSASLVIMNTSEAARRLVAAFPEFAKDRVISITNGFDSEDFCTNDAPKPANGKFSIVHAGFMHTAAGLRQRRNAWQYRLLSRIERGVEILPRSHFYLLKALEKWMKSQPHVVDRVRLTFVGAVTEVDKQLVNQSPARSMVEFTGYVDHAASLAHIRGADLLFLPMHKMPSGRRATIVPGKTYEYMATGIPILAPVPAGDARDFLEAAGTGLICEPDDVDEMVRHLCAAFRAWEEGLPLCTWKKQAAERFERRVLTERLATEITRIAGSG